MKGRYTPTRSMILGHVRNACAVLSPLRNIVSGIIKQGHDETKFQLEWSQIDSGHSGMA